MYRYTTPTLPITIENLDFADVQLFRIAIEQENSQILKIVEANDSSVNAETNTIYVPLTQEETASLKRGGVNIQVRVKFQSGSVLATNTARLSVGDVLDEVII